MKPQITEISIIPIQPRNGLVGFASFIFNSALYIADVGVHTRPDNSAALRLVYPVKKFPNGKQIPILRPINIETGKAIEEAVAIEWHRLIGGRHV